MTSAPGTSEQGFTLVELVVAITIIGIAAAAIVLSLPGAGEDARRSALRLAAHASAARDAAILTGRTVLLTPGPTGWQAGDLPTVRLPAGQSLISEPAGPILFDPTGLASPARLAIRSGEASATVTITAAGAINAR
ncbi:GspH/FimT family pseudopilin [Sandarakinorhabdus cyanobacteriorum]|nr:GspH/FimT family pseudopilin [Sandarakinorhabdus cyanobacteriorum]